MNWYELATAAEAEEVLSNIYRSKWDSEMHWLQGLFDNEPERKFEHPVNFEIAEQLWAEEEVMESEEELVAINEEEK